MQYHIVANGTLWAGDLEEGMDLTTLLAAEESLVVSGALEEKV